jgi:ABC-type antimicrobial peptide transport system permease subunit
MIAIGLGLGLGLSLIATRLMRSVLFEVGAGDPVTTALVGGIVLLVSFGSMLIPAVRAARISPMEALRAD